MSTPGEDLQAYCQTMSPQEALGTAICLANNLREMAENPTAAPVAVRVISIWSSSIIHDLLQQRVAKTLPIVPDHTHCSAALSYFGDVLRQSIARGGAS